MKADHFKVIRGGLNSTFQDKGRKNLYHIGIPFSGVMDNRNYLIANKLIDNKEHDPILEFAIQGPCLKYFGNKRNIVITGDVNFSLIRVESNQEKGECYKTIEINNGDIIDIISTNKSVYGYFSVSGGFKLNKVWNSFSTTPRANVGPNNGTKLIDTQEITLNASKSISKRQLNYVNSKIEFIRVIKGTNISYFSEESINNFFSK